MLTIMFFTMFAIGIKAVQQANETADVITCKANLAKLAQGVTGYETAKGYLPPFSVVGDRPGWNLRILPYIGRENVHNVLVENNRYTIPVYSAMNSDTRTTAERLAAERVDWDACAEALASVTEFRDPSRQSTAIIKDEFEPEYLTEENRAFYGVTTDYATPIIWTDFNVRNVTLTWSLFKLESPFEIYEINVKQGQYWSTRTSEQWKDGKTNTLIVSEKYIPEWAISGTNIESRLFNGGLQSLKQVPQMAAQCIDTATTPIVPDSESPFAQDSNELHSRYWYGMLHRDKPDNKEGWRGNYAWGSNHVGVIVAAMGDGSVRSINKNMNASTFYNLCASNVLPEPTEQEKALADEEFRIVSNREKYQDQETEIAELEKTLKLVQDQLKAETKKQTQLTGQITNLTNQITAMTVVENPALAAAVEALQEQLAEAQTALTACETLIESYDAAITELQSQIQDKQTALEELKITNGDAVPVNNEGNNENN
jgi:hypothetical protein